MTNKQKKNFFVMFFILIAIVSVYFVLELVDMDKESSKSKRDSAEIEVFQLDNIEKVEKLSYTAENEKIVVTKNEAGKWVGEDGSEINSQIVNQEMLPQLRYVVADDTVKDESNLSQFGFDKPINEIEIEYKNGEQHKFIIGSKNAFERSVYYLRVDDDKTIYVVDSVLAETFNKKMDELNNKNENEGETE